MIKITEKYYINAEPKCYVLQEKGIISDKQSKKYGEEKFDILGYYTTLDGCFMGLLKTEIRKYISKKEANTMQELIQKINEFEEFLKEKFKDI